MKGAQAPDCPRLDAMYKRETTGEGVEFDKGGMITATGCSHCRAF